jgi:glycolate oxidase
VFYPDDPASYPCSLVGGRIGTGGWSLLGSRFGHTRDLVISMQVVLPTGEIVEIGDGGGRKLRKSSTGLTLKQLFTGHQGTLGITTEATLELVPRPELEFAAFFAFDDYMKAHRTTGRLTRSGLATLAGVGLTWYTWFEQGRDINVSERFLLSVSKALKLGLKPIVTSAIAPDFMNTRRFIAPPSYLR